MNLVKKPPATGRRRLDPWAAYWPEMKRTAIDTARRVLRDLGADGEDAEAVASDAWQAIVNKYVDPSLVVGGDAGRLRLISRYAGNRAKTVARAVRRRQAREKTAPRPRRERYATLAALQEATRVLCAKHLFTCIDTPASCPETIEWDPVNPSNEAIGVLTRRSPLAPFSINGFTLKWLRMSIGTALADYSANISVPKIDTLARTALIDLRRVAEEAQKIAAPRRGEDPLARVLRSAATAALREIDRDEDARACAARMPARITYAEHRAEMQKLDQMSASERAAYLAVPPWEITGPAAEKRRRLVSVWYHRPEELGERGFWDVGWKTLAALSILALDNFPEQQVSTLLRRTGSATAGQAWAAEQRLLQHEAKAIRATLPKHPHKKDDLR